MLLYRFVVELPCSARVGHLAVWTIYRQSSGNL